MASSTKNFTIGLFALVTVCATISGISGKSPVRINGGDYAYRGAFSFVVSLTTPFSTGHICGGAIISPRHILTAAHCIFNGQPSTYIIRSGMHDLEDKKAIVSKIKSFIIHPNYQSWIKGVRDVEHDIGIIVLEKDLDFQHGVLGQINLPIGQPDNTKFYHVAGWGRLSNRDKISPILKIASGIILLNDRDCLRKFGEDLGPTKLCGYKDDASICPGDSGSPLVSGGRIFGIASMSSCVPGVAHGYVNVYYYINWINSIIAQTS